MRTLLLSTLIALVPLLATRISAAAENCTLNQQANVPLSYDASGGPLIPVTINRAAKSMLVDTGSVFTSVTEQTAADLHLPEAGLPTAPFVLADGKRMDRAVRLSEFTIGHMRTRNFPVLVIPQSEPGTSGWAGTLGPDILANYDVEFDFGAGTFSLFSQDHCPGNVVYWTKTPYAAIPMEIGPNDKHIRLTAVLDGRPVNVLIDTGTSTSAMNFSTARELFGIEPNNPALVRLWCPACAADSAQNGAVRYPFKILSFGGVNVQYPKINLYPDTLKGLATNDRSQMLVGMSILRQLHLYIAYREKTLYVTGADVR